MTNQISSENTISIEDLQAAFAKSYGALIGQLTLQNLNLERQTQSFQARLADTEAKASDIEQQNASLIKSQIALEDQTHTLKAQIAAAKSAGDTINDTIETLLANETELTNRIQELETEIAELKSAPKSLLSPEVAKLAAEGKAIINQTEPKEKAAP